MGAGFSQLNQRLANNSGGGESPTFPGDFKLAALNLISPSPTGTNKYDLSGVFIELNIFEDLFSNTLRGELSINDSTGFMEMFPIIGEEKLELELWTKGAEPEGEQPPEQAARYSNLIHNFFRVVTITDIEDEGDRLQTYVIHFVSEEYVLNMTKKVQKCYNDPSHNIIGKIYRDYFLEGRNRFQVKDLVIESTKNTHSYAIPNFTPFQSINFVASRAVSENHDSKGSFYLFYETLSRGFRCDSVETLMKKEASARFIHAPKNIGQTTSFDYGNVDTYKLISAFDILSNIKNGMYVSRLITHDIVRMKHSTLDYNYIPTDEVEDSIVEESDAQTGTPRTTTPNTNKEAKEREVIKDEFSHLESLGHTGTTHFNKMNSNNLDASLQPKAKFVPAKVYLSPTNRYHNILYNPLTANTSTTANTSVRESESKERPISTATTFNEPGILTNHVEDWLLQRKTQLQQLTNIRIRFSAPGNSSLHVGQVVDFAFPSRFNKGEDSDDHQLYAGRYLITSIKHQLTQQKYSMDMELAKDSLKNKLPGQIDTAEPNIDGAVESSEDIQSESSYVLFNGGFTSGKKISEEVQGSE